MSEKAERTSKNPFFDERDSKYLKLTSKFCFFELFNKKKTKCSQLIPDTVLFNNGKKRLTLIFIMLCRNSKILVF